MYLLFESHKYGIFVYLDGSMIRGLVESLDSILSRAQVYMIQHTYTHMHTHTIICSKSKIQASIASTYVHVEAVYVWHYIEIINIRLMLLLFEDYYFN